MDMDFCRFAEEAKLVKFPTDVTRDEVMDGEIMYGYVVDDFDFASKYMMEHPELHVYTLVSCDDGRERIIDGCHIANREGYLFGKVLLKDVEVEF